MPVLCSGERCSRASVQSHPSSFFPPSLGRAQTLSRKTPVHRGDKFPASFGWRGERTHPCSLRYRRLGLCESGAHLILAFFGSVRTQSPAQRSSARARCHTNNRNKVIPKGGIAGDSSPPRCSVDGVITKRLLRPGSTPLPPSFPLPSEGAGYGPQLPGAGDGFPRISKRNKLRAPDPLHREGTNPPPPFPFPPPKTFHPGPLGCDASPPPPPHSRRKREGPAPLPGSCPPIPCPVAHLGAGPPGANGSHKAGRAKGGGAGPTIGAAGGRPGERSAAQRGRAGGERGSTLRRAEGESRRAGEGGFPRFLFCRRGVCKGVERLGLFSPRLPPALFFQEGGTSLPPLSCLPGSFI